MRRLGTAVLCVVLLGVLFAGAAARAERRALGAEEAGAYLAVGRLSIGGARSCTATLIAERLVLTAAHCLFDPRSGERVGLENLRFVLPAQPPGRASRVARAAIPPAFALSDAPRAEDLRADIALLELKAPVAGAVAAPLPTAPLLRGDAAPRIVSGRAGALRINDACPAIGMIAEVLVLGCAIERGVSGAPVLAGDGDRTRVVAVVSSMGRLLGGAQFTLAVAVGPWIEALRRGFSAESSPAEE